MLWKRSQKQLRIGYVIASKMVSQDRRPVRFMYREQPDNDQDSGWRLFSGFEDDDYANDPDHLSINDPETICQIDPDIRKHLSAPIGSAFERIDPNRSFVKSDWTPPEEQHD
ncbi:MAG: DUF2185 domain-containing protein [Phycisphaerales bacterium JB040]